MNFSKVTSFSHSSLTQNRVWCCNWKFDGAALLSTGEDKTVKIWNFSKDKKTVSLQSQIVGDNIRTIRSACFSPNGRYLATASFDASVILYEFVDGTFEERHKLDGHENEVKCVAFSISGQYLATSSRDKTVFIWQFDEDDDLEVDAVMQNHSADVKFVTWHPTEDVLVSGSYDCSLLFYQYDGQEWINNQKVLSAHDDTVWNAQFDPSGNYLVSVGGDSSLKIWKRDSNKWNCIITMKDSDSKWPLYTVSWDYFSDKFAVGGGDQVLWVYEFDKSTHTINLLLSHRFYSDINCVAFNPACPNLLSLTLDDGNVIIGKLE